MVILRSESEFLTRTRKRNSNLNFVSSRDTNAELVVMELAIVDTDSAFAVKCVSLYTNDIS